MGIAAPPSTSPSTATKRKPSRISVLNHGPAIPEWQRRSIFDPLTRGVDPEAEADADHRTSLGLGLYIAHEIASAHGGTIDLTYSELGGTTFRVVLPRHLPSLRV